MLKPFNSNKGIKKILNGVPVFYKIDSFICINVDDKKINLKNTGEFLEKLTVHLNLNIDTNDIEFLRLTPSSARRVLKDLPEIKELWEKYGLMGRYKYYGGIPDCIALNKQTKKILFFVEIKNDFDRPTYKQVLAWKILNKEYNIKTYLIYNLSGFKDWVTNFMEWRNNEY